MDDRSLLPGPRDMYQTILIQGASSRSLVSVSACWGCLLLVTLLRPCWFQPLADGKAAATLLGLAMKRLIAAANM